MGKACRVSLGGKGGREERWLGTSLPALRLRGGVDPEVGDFAGDISYQSGVDEDGIDPYGFDGRLPDSFPENPESLAGRDDTEEIVIDADEYQRLAKEGTPGPDNLEARDDYVDNDVPQTNDLMHLLTKSRPSGITTQAQGKVVRSVDEYDVRGPSFYLAQSGRDYLDDFTINSNRLTAEQVIAEVRKDEKAKQDREERAASGEGALHPSATGEQVEDVDESREVLAEDDHSEDMMVVVSSEDEDRPARARSMHVSAMGGPEHSSAENGRGDLHVKVDAHMAGFGAQDAALVPGTHVKFENEDGSMSYGVIRMAPEMPGVGDEGKGPGSPGHLDVKDDHVHVECIDATSCMEMRRVPRALLQLVKAGYLSVPVAPSPKAAAKASPRDAAAMGRAGEAGGSAGAARGGLPEQAPTPDGSVGGRRGAAAPGAEVLGAGAHDVTASDKGSGRQGQAAGRRPGEPSLATRPRSVPPKASQQADCSHRLLLAPVSLFLSRSLPLPVFAPRKSFTTVSEP